ncbi:MAG: pre-peptidase C-terminal domain-containing protein [Deltaproteobacteria bacterium]|nr:pre-peptidase C-terminal domain-containing protein [Deltaproteobacteria bacterium]
MRLLPRSSGLLATTALTCLATTVACGAGGAPELSGVTDQVAQVGTELQVELVGTDPDGDDLDYSFRAADLPDVSGRALVTVSPSGMGVFRWTPLAEDVGEHAFDFSVSDGDTSTTVTVTIDVKSAIGSATAPVFRRPLGTGTTVDLGTKKCIDLEIVVEDQDTAQVTIEQEEPVIEGSTLSQEDGSSAIWSWCPTKEQEAETRRTLVLSANDNDNPKTMKPYLVVLRQPQGNCPGTGPIIQHTTQNAETIVDLTIDARVTDDKGLKEAPLFYYSETQPSNPPDLSQMIQLSTLKIDGSATDAVYAADVPNPVANMPMGTKKTLFYVFVADDDDDEVGNCDHSTMSQVFSMTVTSSGTSNEPVCATCTSDTQCGTGDLCVRMGAQSASFCLQSCTGGCPSGYTCSTTPVASVDGASGTQCVPDSGTCEATVAACVDDTNEEDDSRSAASSNATARGALQPGTHDFVSCPKAVQPTSGSKADDDWFQIKVDVDTRVDMWLYGSGESDLDLTVYRSNETILSKSTTLEADENIVKCLTPGTYYVKVNGYDPARSEYLLDYVATAQTCNTTCVDDGREDDDTYSQARLGLSSTANKICPNDDDWYKVTVTDGDKIVADMTSTGAGDLDLHVYRSEFSEVFPCAPGNTAGCATANGSGPTSNEHVEYTVTGCPTGCDHYIVVRGYNGAENDNYGLTVTVQ